MDLSIFHSGKLFGKFIERASCVYCRSFIRSSGNFSITLQAVRNSRLRFVILHKFPFTFLMIKKKIPARKINEKTINENEERARRRARYFPRNFFVRYFRLDYDFK